MNWSSKMQSRFTMLGLLKSSSSSSFVKQFGGFVSDFLRIRLLSSSPGSYSSYYDQLNDLLFIHPRPTMPQFNSILHGLVKKRDFKTPLEIARYLIYFRIYDQHTIHALMSCYSLLDKVELAFSPMSLMIKNGFDFESVTFNTVLKGYIVKGYPCQTMIFVDKLSKMHLDLFLNQVSYGTIIQTLCLLNKNVEALKLLSMIRDGYVSSVDANVLMYTSVISLLCKLNHPSTLCF